MAQVVRHRPFTADNRVRSRASSSEICGRQNDTWTGRSNTSVVSRQYHSNSAPHLSPLTCYSYRKDKLAKQGNHAESCVISEIGEHWLEKYFRFL
jgi:hypothetical protein